MTRGCFVALVLCLSVWSGTVASAAVTTPGRRVDFAPHLSAAAAAMEYWDVTAWLDSGHRLFARFLVTNQGPGVTTAAAVGHVVTPTGDLLRFKWGRRAGAWTLAESRRRLEIGKATLDLSGSTVTVTIASAKRGIDVELAIETQARSAAGSDDYFVTVGMPGPARGRVRLRGAIDSVPVTGAGAVTQTWMERPEAQIVRRRLEVMARDGETSTYVSEVQYVDREPWSEVLVLKDGRLLTFTAPALTLAFDGATSGGDGRYPVPARWEARGSAIDARVRVGRELLRFDPLEILPQPFRSLMALGSRPQRVWAEATVDLAIGAAENHAAVTAAATGIAVATFAQPETTRGPYALGGRHPARRSDLPAGRPLQSRMRAGISPASLGSLALGRARGFANFGQAPTRAASRRSSASPRTSSMRPSSTR